MKSNAKPWIALGAATAVAVGIGLYAASSFTPNSQPAGYLGGGALSNGVLMVHPQFNPSGGADLFMPWFENGAWQGDLVKFVVAANGAATPAALTYDASTSLPDNLGSDNWSARIRFNTREASDATWWTSGRKIITWDPVAQQQTAFRWSALSTSQKTALDSDTAIGAASSPILDFVRGQRDNETGNPVNEASATPLDYRARWNLLGDIVHSTPVYVGAPRESYTFGNYETFRDNPTHKNRAPRVYVGANDGMLHVFDAATGDEVYAYVPSMLLGNLNKLTALPYNHTYFVDGPIAVGDAQVNGSWATVLVGTLGAGGKGVYALNVTDPDLASEDTQGKAMWELNADADNDLGYTYSKPTITLLNDDKWYAVFGNGYMSANGKAKLFVVSLDDGSVVARIATGDSGTAAAPNGLSSPALIDVNNDSKADYAYAGDLNGNMWKFDLTDVNNMKVAYGSGVPLYATGATQAITTQPDVVPHLSGYLVYFGTGRILTDTDLATTDTQSIYAIYDKGTIPGPANLLTQALTEKNYSSLTIARVATNATPDWNTHTGWKVNLPAGERLVTDPVVRAGRLQMITTNPAASDGQENWILQLNHKTGGAPTATVLDLNSDGSLTDADNINGGTAPTDRAVGKKLANGIASAVTFGVINIIDNEGTIDTTFYNNLDIPEIETCTDDCMGGFYGGHIDVDTDSPYGGTKTDGSSSGLGNLTDAHQHEYDKLHGQVYVDYLGSASFDNSTPAKSRKGKMEPRRNLSSMNAEKDNGSTVSQTLNSAEEVKFANTAVMPAAGNVIPGNKKFIVVIANADLSTGGTLRIGNKHWPVKQYQDMLTQKLNALGFIDGNPHSLASLTDDDGDSLLFTLDDIKADNGTLRISFTNKAIIEGGLHPTVTGCVRDKDNPYGGSTNFSNMHITLVPSGASKDPSADDGYRWRNGALTLQLLDASNFTLQDKSWLPRTKTGTLVGGVYAKKFTAVTLTKSLPSGFTLVAGPSGMLYESTLFWHYGDLVSLRKSASAPKAVCYGTSNWQAAVNIERGGLTLGEYNSLIGTWTDSSPQIVAYATALKNFNTCLNDSACYADEAKLKAYQQALYAAINVSSQMKKYVQYRGYAPGHIPPQHLLSIDKQLGDGTGTGSADDGNPNVGEQEDITGAGYSSGPNYREGRRTWTDISPD